MFRLNSAKIMGEQVLSLLQACLDQRYGDLEPVRKDSFFQDRAASFQQKYNLWMYNLNAGCNCHTLYAISGTILVELVYRLFCEEGTNMMGLNPSLRQFPDRVVSLAQQWLDDVDRAGLGTQPDVISMAGFVHFGRLCLNLRASERV